MLADKIYVTRQTISKWENDKTYPDIHNLIALSVLFGISLDELVRGDVMTMKNIIGNEKIDKDTKGMIPFIILSLIVSIPTAIIFKDIKGLISFGFLWTITIHFAIKIELTKKDIT